MTDKEKLALEAVRRYELNMNDPWRNDFVEDEQQADEWRREQMIEEVANALECNEENAEKFFDLHRF